MPSLAAHAWSCLYRPLPARLETIMVRGQVIARLPVAIGRGHKCCSPGSPAPRPSTFVSSYSSVKVSRLGTCTHSSWYRLRPGAAAQTSDRSGVTSTAYLSTECPSKAAFPTGHPLIIARLEAWRPKEKNVLLEMAPREQSVGRASAVKLLGPFSCLQ